MKRGFLWVVALLGVGLLVAGVVGGGWSLLEGRLFAGSGEKGTDARAAILTGISRGGRAQPGTIRQGDLGIKYLSGEELELLGLDDSAGDVKYRAGLDPGKWALGCQKGLDCIVAITDPGFQSVAEADGWLRDGQFVLSVRHQGVTRAYPLTVLAYHEIVNDTFEGEPIAITFCPLCFAGLAFRRPSLDREPLEFRVSGRLYNANLVMVDRQTGSLWSQISGTVMAGPLLGRGGRLGRVPTDILAWRDWKRRHPDAQVLARPEQVQGLRGGRSIPPERYKRSPYEEYMLRPSVGFGVETKEMDLRRMAAKRRVYGLEVKGGAKAYPDGDVQDATPINDRAAGTPVLIVAAPDGSVRAFLRRHSQERVLTFEREGDVLRDRETQTSWNFKGKPLAGPLAAPLEEVPLVSRYWFAWLLFHPGTDLFGGVGDTLWLFGSTSSTGSP